MKKGPNIPGQSDRQFEDVDELFFNDRLDLEYVTEEQYPARIDQAAMDLLNGISLGESSYQTAYGPPVGAMITKNDFDFATGKFYREGLLRIAEDVSNLHENLKRYSDQEIGGLAFQLNQVQYELEKLSDGSGGSVQIDDLIRVIEAIVEKSRTRSMREADLRVVGRSLHNTESVTDAVHQILSDPALAEYSDELVSAVGATAGDRSLLAILDAPEMVTPLWDHQRTAIEMWLGTGKKGYVDMATATGKTVLGLAAIAAQYGALHPVDEAEIDNELLGSKRSRDDASILIVAGQDVILEQWRSEFDEHFDIPRDRTKLDEGGGKRRIKLEWGTIEFTTAPALLAREAVGNYDLVILDEAHQYSRGSQSGRGWASVFDDLVDSAAAILAMSGSVDRGWMGDEGAKNALEDNLVECMKFTVPEAREQGVIADFSWEIRHTAAEDSKSHSDLVAQTATLAEAYDESAHKFDLRYVDPDARDAERVIFESLTDLRSYGQSSDGQTLRNRSEAFDKLVTAALARRPHRWQLAPPEDTIAELVAEHAPDDKVVVLVQSYPQAKEVAERITNVIGEELVVVPEAGGREQFDSVRAFNEQDYRVIVGPGNVLGTGIDMPEADTAINLSKGGVNASLIQRIGRILRNPSGDKRAKFYQLVALPISDDAHLMGEDGRRRLRRSAEFRALGTRLRQLPAFTVDSQAMNDRLVLLEKSGRSAIAADHRDIEGILDDKIAQGHLREIVGAIDRRVEFEEISVLVELWDAKTLDLDHEPLEKLEQQDATAGEGGDDPNFEEDDWEQDYLEEHDGVESRGQSSREEPQQVPEGPSGPGKKGVVDGHRDVHPEEAASKDSGESGTYVAGGDSLFGDGSEGSDSSNSDSLFGDGSEGSDSSNSDEKE